LQALILAGLRQVDVILLLLLVVARVGFIHR